MSRPQENIPPPRAPWNEVDEFLWIGGHEWVDEHGQTHDVIVDDEFDLVVSLHTRPDHGPRKGIRHVVCKIPDGPLTPKQIDRVAKLAEWTADRLRMQRRTLVRSDTGYNRAGFFAALTLMERTFSPHEAVELVRRARTKWALNNELFVDYLTTGLDIAYLLAGLEEPDPT